MPLLTLWICGVLSSLLAVHKCQMVKLHLGRPQRIVHKGGAVGQACLVCVQLSVCLETELLPSAALDLTLRYRSGSDTQRAQAMLNQLAGKAAPEVQAHLVIRG